MDKKKKYKFHPELKLYSKMNVPVIPVLLPMIQVVLRLLVFGERSDPNVKVHHMEMRLPSSLTSDKASRLRATIYTSREFKENGPCILVFHGGGFVYPASLHHYVLARKLAKELKAKAILVDYRLAPKYKFPVAVEDAFSAYQWVLANAEKLGIDKEKIAVCGDSAGGNLSAAVCFWAKNNKIQCPCAQVLIYPVTDGRMNTRSMQIFTDTPLCNTKAMKIFYQQYLSAEGKALLRNGIPIEYFSPIEADSFEGLPPTFIEVAQYDCLRDEGLAFAEELKKAGIRTEVCKVKGAMHGYDIATGTHLVKNCMKRRVAFLQSIFEEGKLI